jgi:hypothetical protein
MLIAVAAHGDGVEEDARSPSGGACPTSEFAEVAVPLTNADGPVTFAPVTKSCRPSDAVESTTSDELPVHRRCRCSGGRP